MTSFVTNRRQYPFFTVILLAVSFTNLLNWNAFIVPFILFIYSYHLKTNDSHIIDKADFKKLIGVYILCFFHLGVVYLIGSKTLSLQYVSRGISTCLFAIGQIYLCYKLTRKYGFFAFVVLIDALMLSYSVNFVNAVVQFGFSQVTIAFFSVFHSGFGGTEGLKTDAVLEQAHATLLIMPLAAVLYYFVYFKNKDRGILVRLMIAVIISLLAYKRIAVGAAIVIWILFLLKYIYNKTVVVVCGIVALLLCLTYIWLIKSGVFYEIAILYDINLMFRDILWPAFDKYYDIDISFIGQGYGFVGKYLALHNRLVFGNNIGGLHNDILKIYIELGFVGFLLYFSYFLLYIPLCLYKKRGVMVSFVFWICQVYLMILYLTDNSMIYASNQYVAYIAPFTISYYLMKQN